MLNHLYSCNPTPKGKLHSAANGGLQLDPFGLIVYVERRASRHPSERNRKISLNPFTLEPMVSDTLLVYALLWNETSDLPFLSDEIVVWNDD